MDRRLKGKINPVLIVGTPENEAMLSLHPDDPSVDCTDAAWQSVIRLERNRPEGKLQRAKKRERMWREALIAKRDQQD